MEFKIIYGEVPNKDLSDDYKTSTKFGSFRIGKVAIYFPSFLAGTKYIPLSSLDGAWVRKSKLQIKGCCAGQIPVYVLHLSYGENNQNINLDKEKDANKALELLKEYVPNLITSPKELIKKS